MSVPAQAVADIIKEQPAWVDLRKEKNYLKIFGTVVIITGLKLNSKNI